MSYQGEETYEVYHETERRAAKEHRCAACKETIPIGHRYARVFIVYEGMESIARCLRCQRIHEHLRTLPDPDDWEQDRMWPDERLNCGEDYREHWGKEPPPDIAALAFALPGEVQ